MKCLRTQEAATPLEFVCGHHRVIENDYVFASLHHRLSVEFTCLLDGLHPPRNAAHLLTCEKVLMQHSLHASVDITVVIEERLELVRFWLLERTWRSAYFALCSAIAADNPDEHVRHYTHAVKIVATVHTFAFADLRGGVPIYDIITERFTQCRLGQ